MKDFILCLIFIAVVQVTKAEDSVSSGKAGDKSVAVGTLTNGQIIALNVNLDKSAGAGKSESSNCLDLEADCPKWSKGNECSKNPSFMLYSCKKSCGQCDVCLDQSPDCSEWVKKGECSKNPGYMNVYCAKSCSNCKI